MILAIYALGHGIIGLPLIARKEHRVRFDLSTNTGFNKHLYFTGYLLMDLQIKPKRQAEVHIVFKYSRDVYIAVYY